jgi:type IV secretion system protein VirD4
MDSEKIMRRIMFLLLMFFDVFILSWVARLFYFFEKIEASKEVVLDWFFNTSFFTAPFYLLSDSVVLQNWMRFQLFFVPFMIYLFWNSLSDSSGGNKKNRPRKAGNGEHGTSSLMDTSEFRKTVYIRKTGAISKISPLRKLRDKIRFEYNGKQIGGKKKKKEEAKKGGLILAVNENKKEVYMETENTHKLIIGATRSGKSRKIIMPSIIETAKSGESLLLTDPKGELFENTAKILKEKYGYEVIKIDFRPGQSLYSNFFNPLELVVQALEKGNIPEATEVAKQVANAIASQGDKGTPSGNSAFFETSGKSIVSALILFVCRELLKRGENRRMCNLASVYSTLLKLSGEYEDNGESHLQLLFKSLDPTDPVRLLGGPGLAGSGDTFTSVIASALVALDMFSDINTCEMTSFTDHQYRDIGNGKRAVFLCISDDDSTKHCLATLYFQQCYSELVKYANECGGKLPSRVHVLMDEFGNMPTIKNFGQILTVSGGRGVLITIAVQDFSQITAKYDKLAQSIKGNCHDWIYLSTSDVQTAEELSKRVGSYTIQAHNSSKSTNTKDGSGSFSSSDNLLKREILMPDEIMRMPFHQVLVLRARHNAYLGYLGDMSEWFPEYGDLGGGILSFSKRVPSEQSEYTWVPMISFGGESRPPTPRPRVERSEREVKSIAERRREFETRREERNKTDIDREPPFLPERRKSIEEREKWIKEQKEKEKNEEKNKEKNNSKLDEIKDDEIKDENVNAVENEEEIVEEINEEERVNFGLNKEIKKDDSDEEDDDDDDDNDDDDEDFGSLFDEKFDLF